jgi:protein gp37
MSKSKIEWCTHTWNPVTGCVKISDGCKFCYAESIAKRFWKDRKFTDVRSHEDRLEQPLHWKKPSMVFVNSMSDLFHKDIPFEFIKKVHSVMATSIHTFQILTKRPDRLIKFKKSLDWYLGNVWYGTSIESQKTADERIPLILQVSAPVIFLSVEPMLEEISLECVGDEFTEINPLTGLVHDGGVFDNVMWTNKIDWVIVGCESGSNRRPCKIEWIESIVDQCKSADVPVFVKQISINNKVIKDISLFPVSVRVREFPEGK